MTAIWVGYLSAALWIASSGFWIWSAFTPPPIKKHPKGRDNAIVIFDSPEDGDWLSVNGMTPPNADAFFSYQRSLMFRNAIAGCLSAAGALCAAVAIALTP